MSDPELSRIAGRLAIIRERIEKACLRAGRDPAEVTLIGVSKRQPVERIQAAVEAGLTCLGESYVQEAASKIPLFEGGLDWQFIGSLQSNKAASAVNSFNTIHSVDRLKIAKALNRQAEIQGRRIRCFIQVLLGNESSKHGFQPDGLVANLEPLTRLEHLDFVGLMTIPRPGDQDEARAFFQQLRRCRDELQKDAAWQSFPGWLSMGMSRDFEVAIEEGATHVRVGTAIFGPRPVTS